MFHKNSKTIIKIGNKKTHENPFAVKEFLKSLYTKELLKVDFERGGWSWNLEQIKKRGITDNVVELMAGKIQKFSELTQQTLQRSACTCTTKLLS